MVRTLRVSQSTTHFRLPLHILSCSAGQHVGHGRDAGNELALVVVGAAGMMPMAITYPDALEELCHQCCDLAVSTRCEALKSAMMLH